MSTERPYHFTHLLQVSKKSLWSLILYNLFHDLIHVYSPGAGGIQPPGGKVLMSTETSCHFCCKFQIRDYNSFWKIHRFTFFPYKSIRDQIWFCRKIGQDQLSVIIWTNLKELEHWCYIPAFKVIGLLVPEKKIFKVFTLYGLGGHLSHATWTVWTNFRSPIPWRLHMKFDFDWPSGCWGEDVEDV